ncbi:MAG: cytochrome c oxidase subunit 3, partial [Deltaproteobacteria bacterium]|nr:cytochrome c oxidase subunit 3 [Deltaproteobacteria bacterium]
MSGQNVIPLDPSRRVVRTPFLEYRTIATLIFLVFDAMIIAGMVGAFLLTRVAAGVVWPPAGQPWFPLAETAINTAALLLSGALIFQAARTWEEGEKRIGPLILTAITLGAFFLFFQGIQWVALIREGLSLTSTQHGPLFCLIVGTHGANALGALIFMGIAWVRLQPLR